jgi:GNAT superfamily N-acetyltransferase
VAVRLRDLAAEDRLALDDLLRDTPEFTAEERRVALELIDDRLGGGTHYRFVVAEAETGPAGYACFGPAPMTDGVWDLYWVVVAASRRGHGVGAALLLAAEQAAKSEGGRMILIETASKSEYEATRRFYERLGYGETARVRDYYRLGDDKLILAKPLVEF